MIVFFHTLKNNIEKFEHLANQLAPKAEIKHFVNERVLQMALNNGKVTSDIFEIFRNEILTISRLKPERIICTCSTFGEACSQLNEQGIAIEKIDFPIAKYLVENYKHIGLAYTAESTKKVSRKLLEKIAEELNREVVIFDMDCTSSWDYFPSGEIERYHRSIAKTLEKNNANVEAIFLAQASMEGAIDFLKLDVEVVSSPKYGVKYFLNS